MSLTNTWGSLEDALEDLRGHEISNSLRYSVVKGTKSFGDKDLRKVNKVQWQEKKCEVPGRQLFTGIPFAIIGRKIWECQFGKDYKVKAKEQRKQNVPENGKARKKVLPQSTKKLDCPARVSMREVVRFPSYKADKTSSKASMKEASHDIVSRIKNDEPLEFFVEYVLCLPGADTHQSHPVNDIAQPQPIDPAVSQKIQELRRDGVTSVLEMKHHLHSFIEETFSPVPDRSNKRFYPSDKIISNHMYNAKGKAKAKREPQDDLDCWVNQRKMVHPKDFLFYRKKTEEESFFIVYQTSDQKRLLARYGSFVLIDSASRRLLFDLPLSLMLVKTNVDYQVVASFVVETESAHTLAEALVHIQNQNPSWHPSYFMTDLDDSQIQAIEYVFKDIKVLLCDTHREQSWQKWVKNFENVVINPSQLLNFLRSLANADTLDTFEDKLTALQRTAHWRNVSLQHYLEGIWLPIKEKWCHAYRAGNPEIHSHNISAVESTLKSFRDNHIKGKTTMSLPELMKLLVEEFLPENYIKYCELNRKFSSAYRKYSVETPPFLHNRPQDFMKHCMERLESGKLIPRHHISTMAGIWSVRWLSEINSVSLGDTHNYPSCDCQDWKKKLMPCKHMFAVLYSDGVVNWEQLSQKYRHSPYITTDEGIFTRQEVPKEVKVQKTTPQKDNKIRLGKRKIGENEIVLVLSPNQDGTGERFKIDVLSEILS